MGERTHIVILIESTSICVIQGVAILTVMSYVILNARCTLLKFCNRCCMCQKLSCSAHQNALHFVFVHHIENCICIPHPLLTLGAHAQRGLWYLVREYFRLSVCYHVFCDYVQRDNKPAISSPHWLDFLKGYVHKNTAFESYVVKRK
jgi:hypothetical protein